MKIAIYHNLPSGGAKRALYEYVHRTNTEIDYDLYSLENDSNESFLDLRTEVEHVYRYNYRSISAGVIGRLTTPLRVRSLGKTYRQIAKDIDAGDYDLVFVHSDFLTHTPHLLKHLKTKSIYYLQEPRRSSFEYNLSPLKGVEAMSLLPRVIMRLKYSLVEGWLRKQDILSVRSADVVLCNSVFSYESILRAYGVRPRVCYLGVEMEVAGGAKVKNADPYVLSVGSLHPNKSHDLTIRSLATIPTGVRPGFIIAHDRFLEGEKHSLQSLAESLGVKVYFSYRVPEQKLVSLYQGAVATVCAAELEPFGLTPLESMACGTPVVAVNEGGYRETVTPEVGVLATRSAEGIGDAIKLVASKKFSSSMLQDYAKDRWGWRRSVREYMDILKKESTD